MIRWGIIGAGNIAHRFAKSLENEQDSVLYAISGRNAEKLSAFAQEFPCEKQYVGFDQLLDDENVDAIYIALPHIMHAQWALQALGRHIPVLCEKPAAVSEQEMRMIADCAKQNDTLFMEAMKPRFVPAYERLMEVLRKGEIGDIQRVETSMCFALPADYFGKSYHTKPEGGGALLDGGIYCASLIEDLLKGDPQYIQTYATYYKGVDMYADSTMQFENGTARLEAGFDRNAPKNALIKGTKGSVTVMDLHRPQTLIIRNEAGERTETIPYENDDFYSQIHHFAQLVKEGKKESPVMPYAAMIREACILDGIRAQFTQYDGNDLALLETQEQELSADAFTNADALALGNIIAEKALEYDRGVSIRIDRCEDDLTVFLYMMEGKNERNLKYMDGKKKCVYDTGHSSAWTWLKNTLTNEYADWYGDGVHALSGGAFPLFVNGEMKAVIQVSGLHEGKDHELVVRSLSQWLGRPYSRFPKVLG